MPFAVLSVSEEVTAVAVLLLQLAVSSKASEQRKFLTGGAQALLDFSLQLKMCASAKVRE